jgi:hypothetical protein
MVADGMRAPLALLILIRKLSSLALAIWKKREQWSFGSPGTNCMIFRFVLLMRKKLITVNPKIISLDLRRIGSRSQMIAMTKTGLAPNSDMPSIGHDN